MSKFTQDRLDALANQSVEVKGDHNANETACRRNVNNPDELLSTFRPSDDEEYGTVFDSLLYVCIFVICYFILTWVQLYFKKV